MSVEATFLFFAIACSVQIITAAFLLGSGMRLGRPLQGVTGLAYAVQLGAVAFAWNEWATSGQQGLSWSSAWFDTVSLGFSQDFLDLAIISLGTLFAGLVMIGCPGLNDGAKPSRAHAAVLLAHSSVVVSWLSATPWAGLAAFSLSLASAVIFRSGRWSSEQEAEIATRDGWERAFLLLFLTFGAAIMGVADGAAIGALGVIVGLTMAFQPFPFLGAVSSHRELPAFSGFVIVRLFPAICAFGLLLQLEPQLRAIPSVEVVGYVTLGLAFLAWLCGLFQDNWRSGLSAQLSGSMPLTVALLVSGTAREATLLAVGIFCGTFALAASGSAIDMGGTHSNSNRKRAVWAKIMAGSAVVMTLGLIGSSSAAGLIPWFDSAQGDSQLLAIRSAALFVGALLAWRIFWQQAASRSSTEASWVRILLPAIPVLASLALLWTGDPAGGVLPGSETIFDGPLSATAVSRGDQGLPVVCGLLVAALLVSLWSDRREDRWQRFSKSFPRMSGFISGGYGVDSAARMLLSMFGIIGRLSQKWLDEKAWNQWLPDSADWTLKRISTGVDAAISKGSQAVDSGPRKATEVSGKLLQLVHNGDVQWYLLLALGCGAAILLHFLNLTGAA